VLPFLVFTLRRRSCVLECTKYLRIMVACHSLRLILLPPCLYIVFHANHGYIASQGLGPSIAKSLDDMFGADVFSRIASADNSLLAVKGLGKVRYVDGGRFTHIGKATTCATRRARGCTCKRILLLHAVRIHAPAHKTPTQHVIYLHTHIRIHHPHTCSMLYMQHAHPREFILMNLCTHVYVFVHPHPS